MAEDLIGPPAVEDDETSNSNHSDPEQELLQPNEAGTSWEPFAFPFMDEDDSSEDGIFVSDSDTDTDFENESNSLCEECLHRANNNGDAMDSGSSNDNDNAEDLNPEFSIEVDEGIEDADNIIENLNENSILNFTQALSVRNRTASLINYLHDVLINRVAARDRLLAARAPAQPPIKVSIVKRKYI